MSRSLLRTLANQRMWNSNQLQIHLVHSNEWIKSKNSAVLAENLVGKGCQAEIEYQAEIDCLAEITAETIAKGETRRKRNSILMRIKRQYYSGNTTIWSVTT